MPSTEIELLVKDGRRLEETRRGYAKSWAEIKGHLSEDFNKHHLGFVRDYFRVQLRIAKGQKVRAKEIMNGLVKRTGFEEFEMNNEPILAAVNIAVRGSTNRKELNGKPIKPAFTLN